MRQRNSGIAPTLGAFATVRQNRSNYYATRFEVDSSTYRILTEIRQIFVLLILMSIDLYTGKRRLLFVIRCFGAVVGRVSIRMA